MRTAEILITLVFLQLMSTMAQSQRTIRVYNFSQMIYDPRLPFSTERTEPFQYLLVLPNKQTFFLGRTFEIDRMRGFEILNFDTAVVLKISFIDNVSDHKARSVFNTENRRFDTSIVLHPDSIAYNDIELVKTVQKDKAWLTAQDARKNERMWKFHNRIIWVLTYDAQEGWSKFRKKKYNK